MNSETILVQPVPVESTIHHVSITMDDFKLNATEGYLTVYQYDPNNRILKVDRVNIDKTTYLQWGQDDNFIVDYALTQLGLTRQSS